LNPDLLAWLASCNRDPERFVLGAFPWGQFGTSLEHAKGPEGWQLGVLRDIKAGLPLRQAIQLATASGHGVGKSALVAWCILWAFTTSPDCRGVVTANTEAQLKTKTWAELGKWFNLFLGREYFALTATALLSKDPSRDRTWRIDMIPWSERNTEAFAGLHNKGKRIILIMDEASAILDKIWETAEGALTDSDTEIIWLAFGNPTRNTGRFKECFPPGRFSRFWKIRQVDSREVSLTNKEQFKNWIEAYGEDSDFVRVRVKGTFPRHGETEFISADDVDAAMARDVTTSITDPLALGVDVARFGSAESVLAYRKGRDARTIPWELFRGLDTVTLAMKVQDAYTTYSPDGVMVDGGGVGGGVVDNVRNLHIYCFDVQFGGKDDVGGYPTGNEGERYANKRAAMWGAMRAWIKTGAIPNDSTLKAQLVGPTYTYNIRNEIVLESKEEMTRRGVESPDRADALALTFAYPLVAHALAGGDHPRPKLVQHEYDPFDKEHMAA
jgi:hypothetical protein